MSGRQWLAVAAAFLLVAAVVVVLAGGRGSSRGSTISRGPGGWLAARRYLEARGARVTLITEPLARYVMTQPSQGSLTGEYRSDAGVLVLAFPWQGMPTADLDEVIDAHLNRGGDLVLAYSGDEAGAERLIGLWRWHQARSAPLAPWRWRSFMHREWELRPPGKPSPRPAASGDLPRPRLQALAGRPRPGASFETVEAGWRPVRVWAPRVLPDLAPGARVLYTSPGGQPAISVARYHGGRVVVLPADALANARLDEAGNADLLEALLVNLGKRWAFDEYHHGLVTAEGGNLQLGRAADLLLAHLILLYMLTAVALARRQGPAWRESMPPAGSAATFLLGPGALHHRLGHHREAAQLLLRRARELDRGLELPPELEQQAASAGPRELVEIARRVARQRAGHLVTDPGEP